jgi:hypothetical protein
VPVISFTLGISRQIFTSSLSTLGNVSAQLSTNGRFMAPQNPGNLNLRLSCFHKRLNLITFGLAEVCIGHGLLRLAGQKALILMHLSHPTR